MSRSVSDMGLSAPMEMDVEDPQTEDFLNPFADLAVASESSVPTSPMDGEQNLAEEGRQLLDPFLDAGRDFGYDNRNQDSTTYTFTSARPRTASDPIANPLASSEEYPFSSPTNLSSYTPEYPVRQAPAPSRSLSRRRGGSSTASSLRAPSVASISTASSTSSVRGGQWHSSSRDTSSGTTNIQGRIEEETGREGMGVRASLDSGMAAVRRWIRSRSSLSSSTPANIDRNTTTTTRRSSTPWNVETASRNAQDEIDLMSFATTRSNEDPSAATNATRSVSEAPLLTGNTSQHQNRTTSATHTIVEEHMPLPTTPNRPPPAQPFRSPRQRALSEPDAAVRDFLYQRALTPNRGFRQLRYAGTTPTFNDRHRQQQSRSFWGPRRNESNQEAQSEVVGATPGTPGNSSLSSPAVEMLYSASPEADSDDVSTMEPSIQDDRLGNMQSNGSIDNNSVVDIDPDPQRDARARWILINRRFQVVITIVALIFSLLLFGILVCWVVLTSAYVVSIDKFCDVPLKEYFWLVTLQLILDVFRTDIMRCIFRWDANSNQRIPCRVITYNAAYLMYAFLVLRTGIQSVFMNHDATCRSTAPELFKSSKAFVTLSIAAWSTIVLGYLLPFCIVATLLTLNGYTPPSDNQRDGAAGPVFPTPMGAPPGCIDQLRNVRLEDLTSESAKECCICMEHFSSRDVIVETECLHRYHKHCLADWLRQARTCPVCRMDVVPTQPRQGNDNNEGSRDLPVQDRGTTSAERAQNRLSLGPATRTFGRNTDIHHEVVSLFQIIRRSELRNQLSAGSMELRNRSGSIDIRNRTMSQHEI
ncbi:ring finger domain containing protein [Nitzschia inconspicua]|uniref:Ring finger domain containing protein n=1 Tax=Nitzschia inconspicua TaxID=303405 RepID=A0A9K3KMJ7_9STRA|nr:ring finger domain containing protein [Nitzschia inconspicua]